MLTTLTQRSLSSFTVKYQFFNGKLSIFIDVPDGHNLFGDVNIELSNCQNTNIYNFLGELVEDVFNNTFLFKVSSETRLEYSMRCNSGLPESTSEVAISDNGSDIEVAIDNISVALGRGKYIFKLIDTELTDFDGALITFKESNIISVGENSFNGMTDQFDQVDGDTNQSIDNQKLTFDFDATMGLSNIGSDTNIVISYIKL